MTRILSCCITTLIAISIGFAQDVNGKWKAQMQTPNGPMDMMFIFRANGDTLTGTVEGPMGSLPIVNGKNNGKLFSFDVNLGEMTINHKCTVMGDSILMKVPGMEGDTMALTLKRSPELKKD